MRLNCKIAVLVFFQTIIGSSKCDRQVTFTCDGDSGSATRGEPGPPGKRGPIGMPGPVGPQGNKADVTILEGMIREMNQTLNELQRYSRLLPSK